MPKRLSLDEIVEARKASANDAGTLFTAVVADAEEAKGYDADKRAQRFIMSTESTDLYGDIVRQAGLKLDNFLKNPVALAFHRHTAPIGWWSDVKTVSGRPKRTEGVLTLHAAGTTEAVDEVERLLQANAIRACSIGFKPLEAEWIVDENGKSTWGLDFKESILLECSVCSIPANPEALAKAAGGDMKLAADLFARVLDTYCEVRSGGLYVRKEYEEAYRQIKERPTVVTVPKSEAEVRVNADTTLAEAIKGMEAELSEAVMTKIREERPNLIQQAIRSILSPFVITDEASTPVVSSLKSRVDDAEGTIKSTGTSIVNLATELPASFEIETEESASNEIEKSNVPSEPEEPALIKGSRAKAIVRKARLLESLREKGIST